MPSVSVRYYPSRRLGSRRLSVHLARAERFIRIGLGACLLGGLTACGNFMAINKPFNVDDGTSISIDAKQRAIFTMKKRVTATEGGPIEWRVVCAEPSPDAITAISAASGATAETLKLALSGSFGSQESAASIGLRTQTIQILRDAMYRLCEVYASSALDDIAFARLQRRYQNLMLGLLAIEQLSGAVVA